jgi:hypothetical protein
VAWCCRSSISGRRRARRFCRYRDDRPVANFRGIGRLAQHSLLLQRWAIDLTQIGNELGVRYAIEASVEQATLGLRINARLFDARNYADVWADASIATTATCSRHRMRLVFLFGQERRWRVERGAEARRAKSLTPGFNSNRLLGKASDGNGQAWRKGKRVQERSALQPGPF